MCKNVGMGLYKTSKKCIISILYLSSVKYHFHLGYFSFTQVTYGLQNFKDIETLMNLYERNKIKITKIRKPSILEKEKAELRKRGNQQNYFDSQEPMQVLPNRLRFSLEGHKVTYLDWKFNFLVQSSSGPALFNVQFKNQRIAYELSLQEASSFYSTGYPLFSSSNTLDSSFGGMGKAASLVKGIDCPQQSIYQDVVVYFDGVIKHVKDAICIFEQNPSVPLRRHHHSTGNNFFISRRNKMKFCMRVFIISKCEQIHSLPADVFTYTKGFLKVKDPGI